VSDDRGIGDCPAPDNAARQDTVGSTLARRITELQPMLEYREEIAILRSDNNRRADLEAGMRDGVARLQAEVERLQNGAVEWRDQLEIAADEVERLRGYRDAAEADRTVALLAAERMCQVLSQKNHCPDPDKVPNEDNYLAEIDNLKATITSLAGDRSLYKNLARQFGEDATRAKKRIEELESGLSDEERAAVEWAVAAASDCEHPAEDTLRSLLERMA